MQKNLLNRVAFALKSEIKQLFTQSSKISAIFFEL